LRGPSRSCASPMRYRHRRRALSRRQRLPLTSACVRVHPRAPNGHRSRLLHDENAVAGAMIEQVGVEKQKRRAESDLGPIFFRCRVHHQHLCCLLRARFKRRRFFRYRSSPSPAGDSSRRTRPLRTTTFVLSRPSMNHDSVAVLVVSRKPGRPPASETAGLGLARRANRRDRPLPLRRSITDAELPFR